MRAHEFVTETAKPAVGRVDQHAEDMIFIEGPSAALAALSKLEDMISNEQAEGEITVKWDGSPAVIFGRNETGQFVFTTASAFGAKGYNGKTTSPEELQSNLLRNNQSEEQQAFAGQMAQAFTDVERIVAKDFRGYFKADILYFSEPPLNKDGEFEFTPQIVTYNIPADSDIGKKIDNTSLGMAVHFMVDFDGRKKPADFTAIDSKKSVFVSGPVSIVHMPKIDSAKIDRAKELILKHDTSIEAMFNSAAALKGMADFRNIIYRFVNDQTPDFTNMVNRFAKYIESATHISNPKKAKILELLDQHQGAFQAMFEIVDAVMEVKDEIIADLDSVSPVKASIAGYGKGGEGYMKKDAFKMVPRKHFTHANRQKHAK